MSSRFQILASGWATLPADKAKKAIKAMAEYRKTHPVCEITGSNKNVQIHHIIPVWKAPALADDPQNMIALSTSANIHLLFGHGGNFQSKYAPDIRDFAEKIQKLRDELYIVYRKDDEFEAQSISEVKPSWLKRFYIWVLTKIYKI